jgi:hypothetical protein
MNRENVTFGSAFPHFSPIVEAIRLTYSELVMGVPRLHSLRLSP